MRSASLPMWRHVGLLGLLAALWLHAGPVRAQASAEGEVAALLAQADTERTRDHPHFLQLLSRLHAREGELSSQQRWRLGLLDAWETAYEGDYAKAEPMLRDLAARATSPDQQGLVNGMLLNMLAIHHRYPEAFDLAETLSASLPHLHDRHTIYVVLSQLSQLMASAAQVEPATDYARQAMQFIPPGESLCKPYVYLFGALNAKDDLPTSDPIFRTTIDACDKAGEPQYANTVELDLARREAETGDAKGALARLKRIAPSVRTQNFQAHVYVLRSTLGFAYWKAGNLALARRWALAALAMDPKGDFDGLSEYVYRVLYEVENNAGDYRAALGYYRHYKDVQVRSVNDAQAVALAYHTVQQKLAIHQLQVAQLSKQNGLLELQQALDRKAMEASRLYLSLLATIVLSIGLLLVWTKRSQLRFKKLARCDSLTGILNHQHFVREAEQALRQAERTAQVACVVLIDLDHFKQINDTYGHATGDAVLIAFSALCRRQLRPGDVFGRLGGEEFGLLLLACSLEAGVAIVDRMRVAIAAHRFDERVPDEAISASFGLACTERGSYDLTPLLAAADAALYRAKHSGRNRVETHADLGTPSPA